MLFAIFQAIAKLRVQLRLGKYRFELQGLPQCGLDESFSLLSAVRLCFLLQKTSQTMLVSVQYQDRHCAFEAVFAKQPHMVRTFALEGIDGGFDARLFLSNRLKLGGRLSFTRCHRALSGHRHDHRLQMLRALPGFPDRNSRD